MIRRSRIAAPPSAERPDPGAELAAIVAEAAEAAAALGRRQLARAGTVLAVIGGLSLLALFVSLAALTVAVDSHR